ncbi:MAG TPA: VOC family protein [Steroidobacteraceae bacterium]|jgi:catechol 2,3-dioxygenase-like lactoylglutathione lyase family enzyme|nr:VOC family protein [Steroidobacteraceae bacterium]
MSDPPFAVRGIDHIVLRVRALPRALGFYRDVLGCSVERQQAELGLTQLRAGHSLIDLVTLDGPLGRAPPTPGPGGPNVDHFCLALAPFREADLSAWLAAHGVEVIAPASRYGAEGEGRSFYVEDPDGNRIELKGAREAVGTKGREL